MRDFKEYFQILWKKNSIWLGILAILAILFQGLSMNYTIKDTTFYFYSSVRAIEIIHDNLDKDNSIINKKINEHWDTYWTDKDKIIEKYKDRKNGEETLNKAKSQFNEILEKRNYSLKDLKKYNEGASEYEYEYVKDVQILQELYNFHHSYIEDNHNNNYNNYNFASLDLSNDVFFDGSMIFIVVILGFLLMSMEHLTPYYEFSRMYPWSHGKTYLMKVIFGGLYILLLYIISILMKIAILKGAQLSDLFSFNIFGPSGIIHLSSIFGLYLIIMASGAISGNVLGHIGMIIISLAGIDLIRGNLIQIFETLKLNTNDGWLFVLDKKFSNLPELLQVLLKPYLGLDVYYSDYKIWYIGVVGLILFLVGYYWTLNAKAERSGMLILTKSVSKFAQFFAVLTTASLINSLFLSMMFDANSILINLAIYIILLAISYKFYKVIFKIRIGL
ncbi:MAG: hypothetical protein ACTHWZ_03330 [Peptoniphilaceae bacterium]